MRAHHEKWGGLTELLAVVWHRDKQSPQILELMPDTYEPRPRHGVIGIGDDAVLRRFKELLSEDLDSRILQMTPEVLDGLSKSVGHPHECAITKPGRIRLSVVS